MMDFLNLLMLLLEADMVEWKWCSSNKFTIKNYYLFLSDGGITSFIAKLLWKLPLLEKVKLFNWLIYHNKTHTTKVLKKKKLETIRCIICVEVEETTNYDLRIRKLGMVNTLFLRSTTTDSVYNQQPLE